MKIGGGRSPLGASTSRVAELAQIASSPANVSLFGANSVVACANCLTRAIEQFWRLQLKRQHGPSLQAFSWLSHRKQPCEG